VCASGIGRRRERASEGAVLSGFVSLTRERGGTDDNRHGCEAAILLFVDMIISPSSATPRESVDPFIEASSAMAMADT
jgi:hypothetical protein